MKMLDGTSSDVLHICVAYVSLLCIDLSSLGVQGQRPIRQEHVNQLKQGLDNMHTCADVETKVEHPIMQYGRQIAERAEVPIIGPEFAGDISLVVTDGQHRIISLIQNIRDHLMQLGVDHSIESVLRDPRAFYYCRIKKAAPNFTQQERERDQRLTAVVKNSGIAPLLETIPRLLVLKHKSTLVTPSFWRQKFNGTFTNTFLNKYEGRLPDHMRATFMRLEKSVFLDLEQMIGTKFMTLWWRFQPFFVHYSFFLDEAEKQWKTIQESITNDFVTPSLEQLPRANFPEDVPPEHLIPGIALARTRLQSVMVNPTPYAQFGILSPRDFWLDFKNGYKPEPHESLVFAFAIHHTLLFYQLYILCTWPRMCAAYDGIKSTAELLHTWAQIPFEHSMRLLSMISTSAHKRTMTRSLAVWERTIGPAHQLHKLCMKEDALSRQKIKDAMIKSFLPEDWPEIMQYLLAHQLNRSDLYEELLSAKLSEAEQSTALGPVAEMDIDLEEDANAAATPSEPVVQMATILPPPPPYTQHPSPRHARVGSQPHSARDSHSSSQSHSARVRTHRTLGLAAIASSDASTTTRPTIHSLIPKPHEYRTQSSMKDDSEAESESEIDSDTSQPNPTVHHRTTVASPSTSTALVTSSLFGSGSSLWAGDQPAPPERASSLLSTHIPLSAAEIYARPLVTRHATPVRTFVQLSMDHSSEEGEVDLQLTAFPQSDNDEEEEEHQPRPDSASSQNDKDHQAEPVPVFQAIQDDGDHQAVPVPVFQDAYVGEFDLGGGIEGASPASSSPLSSLPDEDPKVPTKVPKPVNQSPKKNATKRKTGKDSHTYTPRTSTRARAGNKAGNHKLDKANAQLVPVEADPFEGASLPRLIPMSDWKKLPSLPLAEMDEEDLDIFWTYTLQHRYSFFRFTSGWHPDNLLLLQSDVDRRLQVLHTQYPEDPDVEMGGDLDGEMGGDPDVEMPGAE
jgi:hypothetical protein